MFRFHRRIGRCRHGRFLRRRDGVTTIEFAFVAPILIFLIMGIVEFSLIAFTMATMESATFITSRLGKTGYTAPGLTREQTIKNTIANRTEGLLNPNLLKITYNIYSGFNTNPQPEPCISPSAPPCPGTAGVNFQDVNGNAEWDPDLSTAGLGNAGDIVVYNVLYPWPVMTPILRPILGNPFNIIVRTVVKNEPYGTAVAGR